MTPGPVVGLVVLFHLGSSVEPEDLKGRKWEFSTISTLWLLTRISVFLCLHSFLYGAQTRSSVYVGCMVTFCLNDTWRELWEGLACEAQRLLVHTLPSNTALLTTRYDASHVILHCRRNSALAVFLMGLLVMTVRRKDRRRRQEKRSFWNYISHSCSGTIVTANCFETALVLAPFLFVRIMSW